MDEGYSLTINTQMLLNKEYEYKEEYRNLNFYIPEMESPSFMMQGDIINDSIRNKLLSINNSKKLYRKLLRIQRKRDNLFKRFSGNTSEFIDLDKFICRYGLEGECLVNNKMFTIVKETCSNINVAKSWGTKLQSQLNNLNYNKLSRVDYNKYKGFNLKNYSFNTIFGYLINKRNIKYFYKSPIHEVVTLDQMFEYSIRNRISIDCMANIITNRKYLSQYKREHYCCNIGLPLLPNKPEERYAVQLLDYVKNLSKYYPNILLNIEEVEKFVTEEKSLSIQQFFEGIEYNNLEIYIDTKPTNLESFKDMLESYKDELEKRRIQKLLDSESEYDESSQEELDPNNEETYIDYIGFQNNEMDIEDPSQNSSSIDNCSTEENLDDLGDEDLDDPDLFI